MGQGFSPLIAPDDLSTVIEQKLDEFVHSIVSGVVAPRPQPDTITAWHTVVAEHAAIQGSTLVLRKTSADGEVSQIRGRVYIDPITKLKVVRSDNSPPIWVYNRAFYVDRNPPPQFASLLDERAFAMADRFSSDENALLQEGKLDWPKCLLHDRKSYGLLWDLNWKLCHLLACSPDGSKPKDAFLQNLYDTDRSAALANAFVRNLSAFNHIPGPSPKHYEVTLDHQHPHRKDIGEDARFLDWAIYLLAEKVYDDKTSKAFVEYLKYFGGREVLKPQINPLVRIRRRRCEALIDSQKVSIDEMPIKAASFGFSDQPQLESSRPLDPGKGDLVILVRPAGQEEKYPNVWEGNRLSILVTHSAVAAQIEKASMDRRTRIFVQIAPKNTGKRFVAGSAIVVSIDRSGDDFLIYFADWKRVIISNPPGRSYGPSFYWVK